MEDVEAELLGEIDCRDVGGPGEAPTDELLVSGHTKSTSSQALRYTA